MQSDPDDAVGAQHDTGTSEVTSGEDPRRRLSGQWPSRPPVTWIFGYLITAIVVGIAIALLLRALA